jgi:hypothetical protein
VNYVTYLKQNVKYFLFQYSSLHYCKIIVAYKNQSKSQNDVETSDSIDINHIIIMIIIKENNLFRVDIYPGN